MNLDLKFVYWAGVCDNITFISVVVMIIALALALIFWAQFYEDRKEENKISAVRFFTAALISALVAIFCPSKEVVYTIGIADNIVANYDEIKITVTDTIDYIADTVKSITGS